MPLPAERDRHDGDRVVTVDLAPSNGWCIWPGRQRLALELRDRGPNLRRVHVTSLDHDHVRRLRLRPGTRPAIRFERLDDRQSLRQALQAGVRGVQCRTRGSPARPRSRRRRAAATSRGAAARGRRSRPRSVASPPRSRRRATNGTRALHHPVAELGQQGRQHGQGAEHRDRDDQDRAGRHRGERLVAGEVHPGHRRHHGEARRSRTERPEVAAAASQCGLLVAARSSLLALAPHVEQRVVDADGHPDQQHHLGDRRVDGARGD